MKDSNERWAYGAWEWGLGTDSGVGISGGIIGIRIGVFGRFRRMGRYFCHHVRTLFFSVIRRDVGVEHPKKRLRLSFW